MKTDRVVHYERATGKAEMESGLSLTNRYWSCSPLLSHLSLPGLHHCGPDSGPMAIGTYFTAC
jgi:hypothetical protein